MTNIPDTAAIKDREFKTWILVAPGWRKHDVRHSEAAAPVTERMLALARIGLGHRVLDLACGTGEPGLTAATIVGNGEVIGLDFVEEMLMFAHEKAAAKGLKNIRFQRVDAEELQFPDASFDAVTIRFGLMFMPEPLECLNRVHRVLKPGGHLTAACWAAPKENLWASAPMGIVRKELGIETPPPGSPGLFAFADPSRFESIVREANFKNVTVEPVKVKMAHFDTAAEYFEWTQELAGPVAILFNQISATRQSEVRAEIEREVKGSDGKVTLDGVTWVVHGEK